MVRGGLVGMPSSRPATGGSTSLGITWNGSHLVAIYVRVGLSVGQHWEANLFIMFRIRLFCHGDSRYWVI